MVQSSNKCNTCKKIIRQDLDPPKRSQAHVLLNWKYNSSLHMQMMLHICSSCSCMHWCIRSRIAKHERALDQAVRSCWRRSLDRLRAIIYKYGWSIYSAITVIINLKLSRSIYAFEWQGRRSSEYFNLDVLWTLE